MKLRSPRVWIAVFSAAAVLYISVGYTNRESPGPLAAVHEREPDLTGWNSCAQCHGGWFGSMAGSCLDCHEDIGGQIEAGAGLHGALGEDKANQCARCHSDHRGGDFAMVNKLSFREAGVDDREAFDHRMVGFDMNGRHLELTCAKCHQHADALILPEGGKRFLGLDQSCVTCHEDVHKGTLGTSCAKCHGQEDWKTLASAGHERFVPLVGGHGDLSCVTCHKEDDPRYSLKALGPASAQFPRMCLDCHESPHHRDFVESVANTVAKSPEASCDACHLPEHTAFRQEGLTVSPELHACSGFPLSAPHDEVACDQCHAKEGEFLARYPGRRADTCAACHEDPHGGQFDQGPFAAQGCIGCHERQRFEPHAFTAEKHARSALELTGRHAEIDCGECHKVPAEGRPRQFVGTATRCEGCHKDAHDGFFRAFRAELDRVTSGRCARCHLTTTFRDLPEEGFDHALWTGFPVRGAHAQSTCESCHPRSGKPDRFGRTFGRVAAHFGAFQGCATCHKDPHGGDFDKPGRKRVVDGKTGCVRCHAETSFRALPKGFDHLEWTGFPVDGAHAEAGCAACHAPLREPDRNGRTWGRAKGSDCAACHTDPHAGQFRYGGKSDCARCHRTATRFSDLSFRHNLDSRFRLDKAHAGLACAACHKPYKVGEFEIVRYRPLGRECADCHEAQRNPLRGNRRAR